MNLFGLISICTIVHGRRCEVIPLKDSDSILTLHHSQIKSLIIYRVKDLIVIDEFITLHNILRCFKLHTYQTSRSNIHILVNISIIQIGITITYAEDGIVRDKKKPFPESPGRARK